MPSINTFTEHRSAVVMSLLTEGEAFSIIFSHLSSYLFPCNKGLCSVTWVLGVWLPTRTCSYLCCEKMGKMKIAQWL